MRTIIASFTTITVLMTGLAAPTLAHASPSNVPAPVTQESAPTKPGISQAVYYDLRNDSFGVSDSRASELGYSADEVRQFQQNLAELAPQESRELAQIIGIDVESLKNNVRYRPSFGPLPYSSVGPRPMK